MQNIYLFIVILITMKQSIPVITHTKAAMNNYSFAKLETQIRNRSYEAWVRKQL